MKGLFRFAALSFLLTTSSVFAEHQLVTFDNVPTAADDKPQFLKVGPARFSGGIVANLFFKNAGISYVPWSAHQCYYTHNIDVNDNIIFPARGFTSALQITFVRRASHISFDLGNFLLANEALGPILPCSSCISYNTVRFDIIDDHGHSITKALTGYDPFHPVPTPGQTQHVDFPFDNVRTLTIAPKGVDSPLKWNWALTNVDYDARDSEGFTMKLQAETNSESALVAQDLTAELPLGTRFDLSFERRGTDGSWTAIQTGYEVTDETVTPALPRTLNEAVRNREPLFPNTVLFPYDATVSTTKKTFQITHEGDATIKLKPVDAQPGDDAIELDVHIVDPTSLGVPNAPIPSHAHATNAGLALHFDAEIVQRANLAGIPPQWIKAQIDQETGDSTANLFNPYTLRYEPFTRDYRVIQQPGFFDRHFPAAPSEAQPSERYGDFEFPTGTLLCRPTSGPCDRTFADLDDYIPPHRKGYLYCDSGISRLVPEFGTYPTARQYVRANVYPNVVHPDGSFGREWPIHDDPSPQLDCADKLPRSSGAPSGRSHAVRFPTDLMTFVAQPALASSFGLLQVVYVDMVGEQFFWQGYNGRKNPSLLFDSEENVARAADADKRKLTRAGGGSLKFGMQRDVWIYRVGRGGQTDDPLELHSPAEFDEALRVGIDLYNGGGTGYGQSVSDRVAAYLPQRTTQQDPNKKIFISAICSAPVVTRQTTTLSIQAGNAATLSVDVSGAAPTIYDWFLDTATGPQRISGAEGAIVVFPTTTSTYHAVATSDCGSVASQPITVNITAACTPILNSSPAILLNPTTATLSVSASGPSLSYGWFIDPEDVAPGTFVPPTIVAAGQTATIARAATPVSYRAFVQNQCGFATSSSVIVPALGACAAIISNPSPANSTVTVGTVFQLSVGATGNSLTYQWYEGLPGDTTHPVIGASTLTLAVTAMTDASYWVRIGSDCGSVDSAAANVRVTQTCVSPAVTSQPQSATIVFGSSLSMNVGVAGTSPWTVTWYEGLAGDRSHPLAAPGNVITVSPHQSTAYWAEITNACGTTGSETASVTVASACVAPAITSDPVTQTVLAGQSVALRAAATGTGLSYQWLSAAAGGPLTPIVGARIDNYGRATEHYGVRSAGDEFLRNPYVADGDSNGRLRLHFSHECIARRCATLHSRRRIVADHGVVKRERTAVVSMVCRCSARCISTSFGHLERFSQRFPIGDNILLGACLEPLRDY